MPGDLSEKPDSARWHVREFGQHQREGEVRSPRLLEAYKETMLAISPATGGTQRYTPVA